MANLVLLRDSSKTRFICTCDVAEVYRASKEGWTVLRNLSLNSVPAHKLDLEQLVKQVYQEWGEPGDKILPKRGKDYELLNYFRRLKAWRDENYPDEEPTKSIAELSGARNRGSYRRLMESREQNLVLWVIKWGTLVFAVIACFFSFSGKHLDGPWQLAVLAGTATAVLVLFSGKQSLVNNFNALGIRDPIQTVLILVLGFCYWMSAVLGLAIVVNGLRPSLGETATLMGVFGTLWFTTTGALAAFSKTES